MKLLKHKDSKEDIQVPVFQPPQTVPGQPFERELDSPALAPFHIGDPLPGQIPYIGDQIPNPNDVTTIPFQTDGAGPMINNGPFFTTTGDSLDPKGLLNKAINKIEESK